jgi:probable rRNA maturation factor
VTERNLIILQRRVAGLSKEALDRFVLRARRAAGLSGGVNVLVTTSAAVRALNRRFRTQDKATDVLSFPASPVRSEVTNSNPARSAKKLRPGARVALAGDIAISAEMAARNAAPLRHSTADEVKILILHGMLHLAGFDHERDNGEMARREMKLRRELRLPVALIERAQTVMRESVVRESKKRRPATARARGKS